MGDSCVTWGRSQLIEHLNHALQGIKNNRKVVNRIMTQLAKHKITPGETQKMLHQRIDLQQLDVRVLYLFTKQIYSSVDINNKIMIQPELYFTPKEIREAETYMAEQKERFHLPYTFHHVLHINDDHFVCKITAREIFHLKQSGLLTYNFVTQREAKTRSEGEELLYAPKINERAVMEMVALIRSGSLISTPITLNLRLGSSFQGKELLYDANQLTLTITEGTVIDMLDGFHRITAIEQALANGSNIDMNFTLHILNYSVKKAQEYFAQWNTQTSISNNRIKEMKRVLF